MLTVKSQCSHKFLKSISLPCSRRPANTFQFEKKRITEVKSHCSRRLHLFYLITCLLGDRGGQRGRLLSVYIYCTRYRDYNCVLLSARGTV